jgi:hypothetical protein
MHTLKRRDFLRLSAVAPLAPALASCADEHSIRIDDTLPVGPFGAKSTAEDVTAGIDLSAAPPGSASRPCACWPCAVRR